MSWIYLMKMLSFSLVRFTIMFNCYSTKNVIVTPCSVSLAIRQSPCMKGHLTQHRKHPRFMCFSKILKMVCFCCIYSKLLSFLNILLSYYNSKQKMCHFDKKIKWVGNLHNLLVNCWLSLLTQARS